MKRKAATILLAVTLMLLITAISEANEVKIIVRYALTCNGLKDGMPVDFSTSFSSRSPFIQFYSRFQIINGPVDLIERWIDPNDEIVAMREHPAFAGGPVFNFIYPKSLAPGQFITPRVAGWYRVEIVLAGSEVPILSIPFIYDPYR